SSRNRSRRSAAPGTGARESTRTAATTRRGHDAFRDAGVFTWLWYNRPVRVPLTTVLDRYILRELVSPFVLGISLFTFFLLIDRLYHLTDLVITKGVPFHLVLQLLAFMLPQFLANTVPM